eukprot:Sspe_Gene.89556::Locus_61309_Transcript_1_1_Confidence_1.000_Length_634::g.89556::m.89556
MAATVMTATVVAVVVAVAVVGGECPPTWAPAKWGGGRNSGRGDRTFARSPTRSPRVTVRRRRTNAACGAAAAAAAALARHRGRKVVLVDHLARVTMVAGVVASSSTNPPLVSSPLGTPVVHLNSDELLTPPYPPSPLPPPP